MDSILNLSPEKIDGFFLKDTSTKEGVVSNTTLGGITYNIMDFIDYKYELKLAYLSFAEAKEINLGLLELSKNNQKLEFYTSEIETWGFTSFSGNSRTSLNFQPSNIKIKPSKILGLYDLTLECFERVNL